MSSKKMKKTLQDLDTFEKEMKKKIKLESGTSKDDDSSDSNDDNVSNGIIDEPRKKKENINKEVKEKKVKKIKISKNNNIDIAASNTVPITNKIKADDENTTEDTIDWPEKDLSELFRRMEVALPEKDTLAYGTRVEKLDWENIAFKDYTVEECKKTWYLVQKRLRRFRILHELLVDAREWISKPWTNFYRGSKTKYHPDMPRRPLSTYMLFYLKKKDKILAENPGMEMTDISKKITQMYKLISAEKREKYTKLAAEARKEYEAKLEEFYRKYPDIPRNIEKTSHKTVESGPKKPSTPFGLYYLGQLKKTENNVDVDKHTFKEQCKIQWKNMSDKKKVVWIDWALEEEAKYQEELKNYISQNPDFMPSASKPVLTKEEKLIKERVAGKPIKPPNSAYSLFSRMMLQSEEIKRVSPKNRMNVIANQWKACSEEEKKQYRERANHMMEQYKLDFASYLESLTEEKRKEELQNNLPKRKIRTTSENSEKNKKRKKNHIDKDEHVDVKDIDINRKQQPQQHDEKNVENQNVEEIKNTNEQIRKDTKKEISTKHVYKEIIKDTSKEKTKETPTEIKEPPKEIRRDTQKAALKETRKELIKEEPKTGPNSEKSTGKIKFEGEPASPPASAFALFCKTYRGEKSPASAWKRMNSDEKNKYEARVTKMKREYIVEFEKFLKSLTREQLTAFSNLRQSTKKKKINESDGDTSSNCSSESESEDTDSA